MSSEIVPQEATRLVDESLSSRGMLVVVSSPSGGGKGTLIRRALKSVPYLGYSVSFTTRSARAGEVHGKDYFFVSNETFNEMSRSGEFLEWACVHGNYYGTAWSQVERELLAGRDIILEIDVQGAASVRKLIPDAIEIFILPPSFEVLRNRLIGRGSELPADLELRLKNARDEVEHYREFDYVIINDDLENAAEQLSSIVVSERVRRDRQESPAKRVIATFPSGD
jgi:guanylate kinase